MSGDFDWNERAIAQLRQLWAVEPTISTAEIARRMGTSKNAVVGKAHRLDLPARPSPIHRSGTPRPPRPPRAPRITLAPLRVVAVPPPAPAVATAPAPAAVACILPAAPPRPAPSAAPAPAPYARVVTCCWPLGEPGTRGFRFCDADSEPGRPYCQDHCAVAYVRPRAPREAAA